VEEYIYRGYEGEKEKIWEEIVEEGWTDEKGELSLVSVEAEAGIYSREEAEKDLERCADLFWGHYDICFQDEIIDLLMEEGKRKIEEAYKRRLKNE
jgi:hypothetical protein